MPIRIERDVLCEITENIPVNSSELKSRVAPRLIDKSCRGCLCPFLRKMHGAMTVEASLVVPIFFLVIFSLCFLLKLLFDINQIQSSLQNATHEFALTGTRLSTIESFLADGLIIQWDDSENPSLCYVEYPCKIPYIGGEVFRVRIYQQMKVKRYEGKSMIPENTESEVDVYITGTGRVYHKDSSCSYLNPKIEKVLPQNIEMQRNSSGGKYHPCENCCKNEEKNLYYITPYGEAYHIDKNCKGLKRSVRKVKLSEVGLPPCSKCVQEF